MKKERLVIFVPGAKYIHSKFDLLERIITKFYELTNIKQPVYVNYARLWEKRLKKVPNEVIWLHWNGGISFISKYLAVRRLKRIINHYKNTHNISIIGLSFGGEIVLEACKESQREVKSIVLLCSTNEVRKPNIKIPIFNIYSPRDTFEKISTKVLSPLNGSVRLYGKNVKNISIPNFRHEQFCIDGLITKGKFKNKRLSDIVNSFILS
jgi:hypothetical protein